MGSTPLPDDSDDAAGPLAGLSVSTDADPDETAAIAAAVAAHLADEERAAAAAENAESSWAGRRWAFAGRIEGLHGNRVRFADSLPTDSWTAAGRIERL